MMLVVTIVGGEVTQIDRYWEQPTLAAPCTPLPTHVLDGGLRGPAAAVDAP